MPKDEVLEFPGVVSEILPNATYRVKLERERDVIAVLASSAQGQQPVRIGESVVVEVKPYDLGGGRITLRLP